MAKGADQ
jgi:hypothetical protein